MRIDRLSIENYRGLHDLDLWVGDNLVLVGGNGAGKSSVLRALHLLLRMSHTQLPQSMGLRDFSDPSLPVVFEASFGAFTTDDQAVFADQITIDTDQRSALVIRLEAHIDTADPDSRTVRRFFPGKSEEPAVTRVHLDQLGLNLLRADRSFQKELGPAATGAVKTLLSQVDLGDDQAAIVESIDGLHALLDSSSSLRSLRVKIAAGLTQMFPHNLAPDSISMRTAADPEHAPLADVLVYLLDSAGERSRLDDQADGLRSVALLTLSDLLSEGGEITAVDEPEIHLHPVAQTALGRVLVDSPSQQIIATHSGRVAAAFDPAEVVCLAKDRAPRQVPRGHGITSAKFVNRWWRSELVESLSCEKLLYVEGVSDRIVVDAVAREMAIPTAGAGVHVIELDGSGTLTNAVSVFGGSGFRIPSGGMCDEDAAEKWAEVFGVEPNALHSVGIHVCKPDLEGEVVTALGSERFLQMLIGSSAVSTKSLLGACGVVDLAGLDDQSLATWWRRKRNKVTGASAVSSELTAIDAQKLTTVLNVLGGESHD